MSSLYCSWLPSGKHMVKTSAWEQLSPFYVRLQDKCSHWALKWIKIASFSPASQDCTYITTLTRKVILEKLIVFQLVKNISCFMKSKIPCHAHKSRRLVPVMIYLNSVHNPFILQFKSHFNISLPTAIISFKLCLPFRLCNKKIVLISHLHHVPFTSQLIWSRQ
jgi:hypothetical protein